MAIPNKCHTLIRPSMNNSCKQEKSNFDLCGNLCGVHMVHDLCVIVDSFQHGQVPSGRRAGALGLRCVKQAMLISCSQPNTETHQPHIWMSTTRLLWPFENFRLYLLNRERDTSVALAVGGVRQYQEKSSRTASLFGSCSFWIFSFLKTVHRVISFLTRSLKKKRKERKVGLHAHWTSSLHVLYKSRVCDCYRGSARQDVCRPTCTGSLHVSLASRRDQSVTCCELPPVGVGVGSSEKKRITWPRGGLLVINKKKVVYPAEIKKRI